MVYTCLKCQQYSYVKIAQKTAKCLRCGRSHRVSKILQDGEIIKGITAAMNYVKQKQNELGIKKSEFSLDLRSESDFRPVQESKLPHHKLNKSKKRIKKHKDVFKTLLLQLFTLYKQFPKYMIELITEDCKIPPSEVTILIKRFEKKEILVPVKNNYYTVKKIS